MSETSFERDACNCDVESELVACNADDTDTLRCPQCGAQWTDHCLGSEEDGR